MPNLWDQQSKESSRAFQAFVAYRDLGLKRSCNAVAVQLRLSPSSVLELSKRHNCQSVWLGVFPAEFFESFIEEQQKLIKSVRREHLDKIALAIKRGIRGGRLEKDMAKDIRAITDISKRRAKLIARNAPLQYSGAC